jgi:hypothetical protein
MVVHWNLVFSRIYSPALFVSPEVDKSNLRFTRSCESLLPHRAEDIITLGNARFMVPACIRPFFVNFQFSHLDQAEGGGASIVNSAARLGTESQTGLDHRINRSHSWDK